MRRSSAAFTLVELLVAVVIIGILASMGLANFVTSKDRAAAAGVKSNMHSCQIAAEGYHTQTTIYSDSAAKLAPFFPNGSFTVDGTPGNRGNNPYTNVWNDSTYDEVLADSAAILSARSNTPTAGPGGRGQVGYCITGDGNSYAVCGLDGHGIRMPNGQGGTLVLSNF
jgi:prepilin-type N-terminal cleavage/methylation domain-containing protein